jgi:radical SAM protein with 4Fe4S-binding SPASM domain
VTRDNGSGGSVLTLSAPAFAWLELTYACPGRCPGCPKHNAKSHCRELTGEEWTKIIDELAPHVEEIRLTGGEPTLHPDFAEIVRRLEEKEIPYRLYTNGLWEDPDGMHGLLEESRFLRDLVFSLHSSMPVLRQIFSGLSESDAVTDNIAKSLQRGLPVRTVSVLGQFNRGNLKDLVALLTQLGVPHHHFVRYLGPRQAGISLNRDELRHVLNTLLGVTTRTVALHIGQCVPRCFAYTGSTCLAGITHFTVSPYGSVKGCPFSDEELGEWRDGNLLHLWRSREMRAWAGDIPEGCSACATLKDCMGGCRVMRRNFLFRRDPLMEEPTRKPRGTRAPQAPSYPSGSLVFKGKARREPFGYSLMRNGEVVPVSESAWEVVKLCDGARSLDGIAAMTDPRAREFLASLYHRGFLEAAPE